MQTTAHYAIGETHAFRIDISDKPAVVVQGRIAHAMRVTASHETSFLYGVECTDERSVRGIESLLSKSGDGSS